MLKAQAAMESLFSYGWALVIIMGAIGVMILTGVIDPAGLLTDSCTTTAPFACAEAKVTPSNASNVQILVSNGALQDMASVTVALSCDDGSAAIATSPTGTPLLGSRKQAINFTCPQTAAGMRWKGNFTISYTKSGESITHSVTGVLAVHVDANV